MHQDLGPVWCGFVYSGPSENHCSIVQVFHFVCFSPPPLPPSAGCSGPHSLTPAASEWGYWLPVQWAHQLSLFTITKGYALILIWAKLLNVCLDVAPRFFTMVPPQILLSVLWNWDQMENKVLSKQIYSYLFLKYVSLQKHMKHMPFAPSNNM